MRFSPHRTAFRLALTYVVLSGVWILFSDHLAASLTEDPQLSARLHTLQDWAFAVGTSVLLFILVRRALFRVAQSEVQAQWAEDALRQTEDSLRLHGAALEAADNAIAIADRTGRIAWVNSAFTRLTGHSAEEALQQKLHSPSGADRDADVLRQAWDTILDGQPWHGEVVVRRKNGTAYTEEQTVTPVRNAFGAVTHVIAIKQDVTSRKRAEAAVDHERHLLRTLIDNLPDYIFIKDAQSRFIVINRAQAALLGVSSPEEAVGKTDLDFLPPDMARQYRTDEERVVTTGGLLLHQEERGPGRTGEEVEWHLTTKVPWRDSRGQIVGLVGISRNITDLKRAEEALLRHTRQLETIRSVGAEITRELNLTVLLDLIVHRAAELIGVGSGSVIQGTRVVAILLAETAPVDQLITQYPDNAPAISPKLPAPKLPIINVLTAATTAQNRAGSAVKDPGRPNRMEFFDPKTRPAAVFWDEEPLLTAPVSLARTTGTSVFWRSLMNLGAPCMAPLSEGDRLQAFRLSRGALARMSDPQDAGARVEMCAAAFLQNRDADDGGLLTEKHWPARVVYTLATALFNLHAHVGQGEANSALTATVRASMETPRLDDGERDLLVDFDADELALLRQLFRDEAHEALEQVTARAQGIERGERVPDAVHEMMRVTHTLKGSAGTGGLGATIGAAPMGGIVPFYIPRSLVNWGGTCSIIIRPSWHCVRGAFYFNDAASYISPYDDARGNSGLYETFSLVDNEVCATRFVAGTTGSSGWVAGLGDVDGGHAEFTLIDWAATGTVEASINGLVQPNSEVTLDTGAGTATLHRRQLPHPHHPVRMVCCAPICSTAKAAVMRLAGRRLISGLPTRASSGVIWITATPTARHG